MWTNNGITDVMDTIINHIENLNMKKYSDYRSRDSRNRTSKGVEYFWSALLPDLPIYGKKLR